MKLELYRTYYDKGTNGRLLLNGEILSYTIELPWKNNASQVSCIPEGKYALRKRYSLKFGWHLQVMNVPGRQLILIHPANDAIKELKGCIAPVSLLTGQGKGSQSRIAHQKIKAIVYQMLEKKESVWLIIKSRK